MKVIVLFVALLLAGCQLTDSPTVVLPEGPAAAQLNKTKDEQIAALTKQTEELKTVRAQEQRQAAKAASSIKGIEKAREYLPVSPANEAIGEESKLAQNLLPPDDPAETVRALERVVALITGERDRAMKMYGEANSAAEQARKEIRDRDATIVSLRGEIDARKTEITRLETEKAAEQIKHANDVKDAIAAERAKLEAYKKEQAEKERKWWINATRIAGLGFIIVGVLAMVVIKAIPEGATLSGAGVLIGLLSIFFDWLTAQWFFPWLMGLLVLLILGAGGYMAYRAWKTKTLHAKTTAAIQDFRDEATILGNGLWEKFEEHAKYRLGGKGSFWGKAQLNEAASLGLVNPAAESGQVDKKGA